MSDRPDKPDISAPSGQGIRTQQPDGRTSLYKICPSVLRPNPNYCPLAQNMSKAVKIGARQRVSSPLVPKIRRPAMQPLAGRRRPLFLALQNPVFDLGYDIAKRLAIMTVAGGLLEEEARPTLGMPVLPSFSSIVGEVIGGRYPGPEDWLAATDLWIERAVAAALL